MAQAAQWGLEVGFLGIDGHLEPRMRALLEESVKRLFGLPYTRTVNASPEYSGSGGCEGPADIVGERSLGSG